MRNEPADYVLARLFATLLFGAALFVAGYYMGEHRGYLMAKAECKPVAKPVSEWTKKQKVKSMMLRYDGVILK